MNERVVAALVVGGSLPESIAADVRDYGVSFHPDEGYLSRLQKGGAAPIVLDALRHAKAFKPVSAGSLPADSIVLDHILAAGDKLQNKKSFDAAKEIAAAGGNLEEYPELAFVMGEVMRIQDGRAQSAQLYAKLADDAPEFPEVHTKFSYALYKVDDYESGLQEAVAALARAPLNPEAHKNKGLNLEGMGNFDAAIAEYEQALALKPDYEKVRYNLGLLYYDRKDYRNSIAEYRKALVLDPGDGNAHYNLALSLGMVHEYGSAIDECRKLIELDPRRTDVRMKLADLLVESGQREAGIAEFRQLISLLPDSSYCHRCFARLLYRAHQLDEAEKEYRIAIQLDPTDAFSHAGLGLVLKRKKQPDEALKEFLQAGKLGFDTGVFHSEVGEIYLDQKQTSDAIRELKQAVSETPEDGRAHFLLARALEADDKSNEAIGEYRQAATLFGLSSFAGADVEKNLAAVLEKSGRSAEALQTYKQRYEAFPNEDTKSDYNAAKQRLAGAAVQNSPAIAKAAPARSTQTPVVSDTAKRADDQAAQVQALFDEKSRAMQAAIIQQRWNEAEELGNAAVALAEKMVPQDDRLVLALRNIGQVDLMQRKFADAEKDYVRALQVSEQLFGPKNPNSISALNDLGLLYVQERSLPQAVEYLNRAVTLAEAYEPQIAEQSLDLLGDAQREQGNFKSAEQSYKKMLTLEEARGGPGSFSTAVGLERLGLLYFDTRDYAQAQSAFERILNIDEKQFGPNSSMLQPVLDDLARALHGLGKNEEAQALEHRRELIAQNQVH